ncbi:MAG: ImmA/IrrE family metallo-endopeptidase [Bacteroidetes bacterium]|nr:MAG: ImmA/IrrE family metallo-endopeptidase [Bacteroidota bacterium]
MKEIYFNPYMLILARESRGISQSNLAKELKISQGLISQIELKIKSPSIELLTRISEKLNYPISFFSIDWRIYSGFSFHRKRKSLGLRLLNTIDARINIQLIHLVKLLNSVEIIHYDIPFYDIDEFDSIKLIAQSLRTKWKIPKGPIDNLVKFVEQNGAIVILFDFYNDKIDGLSIKVDKLPPVFFLNKFLSGDRLRFTLAHELGHIIMHDSQKKDIEKEAHNFASEFLMPEDEIKHQLQNINLDTLFDLKRYWKVSAQALLVRAEKLNTISENKKSYLWAQINKFGYRKKEPIDIMVETPSTLKLLIDMHNKQLGYSNEQLSKILNIKLNEFESMYQFQNNNLKIIK